MIGMGSKPNLADCEGSGSDLIDALSQRRLSLNFTAADLCCAGETWERTRIRNVPEQAESWEALAELCETILEPVAEHFGRPEITYGFASPALLRLIPAHIAPALDQHVSCELNRRGNLVCSRLGAAADFRITAVPSAQLAIWIAEQLPFDRLYFYGDDRPIHVSTGPDRTGGIVAMLPGPSGRRVPRKVSLDWLRERASE